MATPSLQLPIPWHVVTLAALEADGPRPAELSIVPVVSVFDGEIGDPITWTDEVAVNAQSRPGRGSGQVFQAVAEDIRDHLAHGTVAIHGAPEILELIGRILPGWRPASVIDILDQNLRAHREMEAGMPPTAIRAEDTRPRTALASADLALATARLLVHLVGGAAPRAVKSDSPMCASRAWRSPNGQKLQQSSAVTPARAARRS